MVDTLSQGHSSLAVPLVDCYPSWSSRDLGSQIISLAFCLPKLWSIKVKNERKWNSVVLPTSPHSAKILEEIHYPVISGMVFKIVSKRCGSGTYQPPRLAVELPLQLLGYGRCKEGTRSRRWMGWREESLNGLGQWPLNNWKKLFNILISV